MKRITCINIQLAYPDLSVQQQKIFIRNSLKNQCMSYIESIKCWGMPAEYNLSLLKNTYGEQYVIEALANKKGVIAHFGCWELLNTWLNLHTSPMIMYKPNKNKGVDRFILEARQRLNAIFVPIDKNGVRTSSNTLNKVD